MNKFEPGTVIKRSETSLTYYEQAGQDSNITEHYRHAHFLVIGRNSLGYLVVEQLSSPLYNWQGLNGNIFVVNERDGVCPYDLWVTVAEPGAINPPEEASPVNRFEVDI